MTPGAQTQAVIEILEEYQNSRKPLDHLLSLYLKGRRYIGSKDRQKISEAVYDVIRKKGVLAWWGNMCGFPNLPRIWIILNLLLEGKTDQEIGIIFCENDYHPSSLKPFEQKGIAFFRKNDYLSDQTPEHVRFNVQEWMLPYLKENFGKNLELELEALNQEARFDLRVNLLKVSSRDEVELESSFPTPMSPWGLYFKKRMPLGHHPLFKSGVLEVQDEGSQLIVKLLDPKPAECIVDYCAGAGGKSLAIAPLMENKGRLILSDTADWRLERAKERLKRAGVHNYELRPLEEDKKPQWVKRLKGKVDRLLLDVPCSGSGTWRRNPELKWDFAKQDLEELLIKQQEILETTHSLLRPGGVLVYATCSLLSVENENQIDLFLKNNPSFKRGEFLKLSPYKSQTDGFFAQLLVKEG